VTVTLGILAATIRMATPLILAGLGGIASERAGVVNIALEGMMLTGALAGVVLSGFGGNPWIGVAGALAAGGLMGLLHAVASVTFRANQVVSGVAINLLAGGGTVYLLREIWGVAGTSPKVPKLPVWGPFSPLVWVAFGLIPVAWFLLYRTRQGLRLRVAGEHPQALETVGISVARVRYGAVILSGALAGLAGAYLSLGELDVFVKGMTAGRGFIALAAVIFGKWNPAGLLGAGLLFGFFDALTFTARIPLPWTPGRYLPSQFVNMLPYLATMIVLAGAIGRAVPPRALGEPYEQGKR
jgi:general nucleoside transport system permease protein